MMPYHVTASWNLRNLGRELGGGIATYRAKAGGEVQLQKNIGLLGHKQDIEQ